MVRLESPKEKLVAEFAGSEGGRTTRSLKLPKESVITRHARFTTIKEREGASPTLSPYRLLGTEQNPLERHLLQQEIDASRERSACLRWGACSSDYCSGLGC